MNSSKTYPMSVMFTREGDLEHSEDTVLQHPVLIVVPRFPGCQVRPEKVAVDISQGKAVSEFWLTPFTKGSPQGKIPAWIEVWYEGKIQEQFPTSFKIVASMLVVVGIVCTFLFSISGILVEFVNPDISSLPLLVSILEFVKGWRHLGVICGSVFLLGTVFLFLICHDREAEPIEKRSILKMK
jgi:hypothetical protein